MSVALLTVLSSAGSNNMGGEFFDFRSNRATTQTATQQSLLVRNGSGDFTDPYRIDLFGEGFTYGGQVLARGTIRQIDTFHRDQSADFTITGLAVDPQDLEVAAGGVSSMAVFLNGDDTLQGGEGADRLGGYGGHDVIFGGAGSDVLRGSSGNDHLYGQSPNGGTDGDDAIDGEGGSDYIQGNAGNDSLSGGEGSDRINGGGGNDTILGDAGNDTINGNLGHDLIGGGEGNDSLRGGQGDDSIVGGAGNDIISGDLGVDRLTGGSGADIFQFSGPASPVTTGVDMIDDFTPGTDHISVGYSVSALLTAAAQPSLSQAAMVAQQLFDGHAGKHEVAMIGVGSDSYVFYSSNGGNQADSAVLLSSVSAGAIGLGDFILL